MWLRRSHPNFFLVFVATIVFHVLQAIGGLFGPDEAFAAPSLVHVNAFAPHEVWGAAFAVVAAGLLVGLLLDGDWWLARIALSAGTLVTVARALLIAWSAVGHTTQGISGVPTWLLVAVVHFAQTSEPPSNPASSHVG